MPGPEEAGTIPSTRGKRRHNLASCETAAASELVCGFGGERSCASAPSSMLSSHERFLTLRQSVLLWAIWVISLVWCGAAWPTHVFICACIASASLAGMNALLSASGVDPGVDDVISCLSLARSAAQLGCVTSSNDGFLSWAVCLVDLIAGLEPRAATH